MRSVTRPPTYDAIAIAAVSADMIQPAITADRSRSTSTAFTNNGTSTIAMTRPAPTMKFTASATCRLRPRKSCGLSNGSSAWRSCQRKRDQTHDGDAVQPACVGATSGEILQAVDALDLGRAEQRHVQRHECDGEQHGPQPVDRTSNGWPVVSFERPPGGDQPDRRASGRFNQNCHCHDRNRTSIAP